MITSFYMPTRIVSGSGALATIGTLARDLKMTRVLVVSDPVISAQGFHADALAALNEAGIATARFDACGIDARCSHIDDQGERVRRDGIDGVVCIGGGSVMCTGKGIAIVATNHKPMAECTGVGRFDRKALPMIMVPTTAGSGSEVSQWTIVKDEVRHLKLLGGGPLSFPDAAILDPVTLRSLPMHVAALPAVDALTHGVEAYLSGIGSPLTDAVALAAVRLQAASLRASINADDDRAREDNLVASCMANIACGNARLGHGHALSLPLEGHLDLPHPYGVGVLLPHVIAFNLAVLPAKVGSLAEALEVETAGLSRQETIESCADAVRALYADIGFPTRFTPEQLPRDRVREMALRAVPGLYAGIAAEDFDPATANDRTLIASPAARKMTVRQAEEMFERCVG
ncbi:iron-containing alcohol dehydrogenase [Methylobacterium nonmethylotrophicum]|uniref:Iron-containing alcohol dehydrogenase n=1 Tax=Methylobacterium nonmethylotrophicum TaxID=1141884 RepID=A0A4Z0NTZ0_9HYPH|nr:iron-containing alcohol dehydrogenase [Methylobacterium nonmethylotrophicum]TGE00045.1 iron-containing alcohol dehydrogenase [Methylobacterium nonmethylotrophicum]